MTPDRLASLAMYDGGDLTSANDVLWRAVAGRLESYGMRGIPRELERTRSLANVWSSDHLLFGQTCGHPFAARYRGHLRLLATPQYDAPGCTEDGHRSFIIVNTASTYRGLAALRGAHAVINDEESMTGRHLLGDAIATAGGTPDFFGKVEVTGSHARSLARVAAGAADVAAIDCVSFAHFARWTPELVARTRIIHRTRVTPALPFVISTECGEVAAALVRRALAEALDDPSTAHARKSLLLVGIRSLLPGAYDRTLTIAASAHHVLGHRIH